MDTLYTFWDNTTHYKTDSVSVHFWGLMNSATKVQGLVCLLREIEGQVAKGFGFRV